MFPISIGLFDIYEFSWGFLFFKLYNFAKFGKIVVTSNGDFWKKNLCAKLLFYKVPVFSNILGVCQCDIW